MDKNTIAAIVLMGVVLVVFSYLGRPSKEQLEAQRKYNDSIAAVHQQELAEAEALMAQPVESNELDLAGLSEEERDSILKAKAAMNYGELASATTGEERTFVLENDSVAYQFSTKGGFLVGSELKTYSDYQKQPIRLIRPEEASFGFSFITRSNRVVSTKDLYFEPEQMGPNQLKMTLKSDSGAALSFIYTLESNYLLDVQMVSNGFDQVVAPNAPYLDAVMSLPIYQNEKAAKTEQRYSGISYETASGSVEKLSTSKSVEENISGRAKWVAFRDMFFSSIFYSPNGLESVELISDVKDAKEGSGILKQMEAKYELPLTSEGVSMKVYVGPNDYNLLKGLDEELGGDTHLSKVVEMGGWFRFINIWIIQPVFNFLEKFFSSYGLIILLLTIFIKLLVLPFTYKSYQSQAKMRVLRPQVDAINEKYPGEENMMKRQQETMALYRKVGVSSMGGCLPMLLQMPILMAMYQYFPTSINLRGQSFLWASDLSTYDDVLSWGFNVPLIGDHLSLFCLIMTVVQIFYMNMTQRASGQSMPGMKLMPWIMGIMLFFFLNENAAALSYYLLLSMLISILQTQIFKWTTNDEKLLAELEANKKKPKKKSKWMARLEEMQKQQEQMLREQQKKK
ncbi:inner membrane protein translocase component YidC [Chlamydia trachomatis]|nr:inner membrane protein translocase component YidC [Chlamydia trachomatis]